MEVFTRDYFNLHQQDLHQPLSMSSDYQESNADPYQRFGGSTINPSYLNENGPGYLPSDCANSQAQVLTPAEYAEPDMPCLPYLSHDDIIEMVRPPYSDKALIAMAFQNAPEKKLTLRQICKYVMENFPLYKRDQTGWQKNIKHTLFTNNCFKKVTRPFCDPGQAKYWTLDPSFIIIKNGKLKMQQKTYESKPCKKLENKKNVMLLKPDGLYLRLINEYSTHPPSALDTSTCLSNFISAINAIWSNGASTELTEDFSPSKPSYNELYACPIHDNQNSLPEANLPQALAL
ncbi:forkhead box protein I2-A-like [Anomaloglossus baeobatrachus]|uniref:forkhead box protein I2-A-like n=1 Tax=Anomaloglossus baeobatrachus TaxID=238106 RepID=UPI003F507E81